MTPIPVSNMDQEETWSTTQILGPGMHMVDIAKAEEGKSSTNKPQIELEFKAIDGTGEIRDWLVVVPQTYGKVKQLLEAVGINVEGGDWDLPVEALPGKRLGILVRAEPKHDDPSKTVHKVAAYLAPSDTPAASSNGGGGSDPFANQGGGGDDIPF